MNQSKGTIYFRDNAWYRMENVIKMGISSFVKNRSNGYITGEIERGEYIHIIEIPLEKMKILDKCLKSYFKSYHIYKGGGTEFYNRCIIDLIEPYLKQINIDYKIYTTEEIKLINGGERIRNIPNVDKVKHIFDKLNVNDIIQKYKNKKISQFFCEKCNYCSKSKSDYTKHLSSKKHNCEKPEEYNNICNCNKKFKSHSGLWRHRFKCSSGNKDKKSINSAKIIELLTEIKNNQKTPIINNYQNNNINIQMYLNDHSKLKDEELIKPIKINRGKLMELLRECRRKVWLYETKQIVVANEIEMQKLSIIYENILDSLEKNKHDVIQIPFSQTLLYSFLLVQQNSQK